MGSLRRQLATAVTLAIGALLLGATSASAGTFSSTTPITIASGQCSTLQQPAVPYPSSLEAEQTGTITDVNVTLTNFSHTYPEDVRVLLVGPQGQTVLLMHEAGSLFPASDVTFTLDDEAATTIPAPLVAGTYRPTQTQTPNGCSAFGGSPSLPGPAPGAPYGTTLDVFDDTNLDGFWSLYVVDTVSDDDGDIEGWCLAIATVEDPEQGSCTETPATYPDVVLEGSPAGYWRFGEPSGATALDSSPNGNHGTYVNGPLLGQPGALTGDSDTAVLMDGVNDLVRVPDSPTLDVGASFTAEGWIKRSSSTATHQLMNKGNNGLQLVVMNAGAGNQVYLRKTNVTTIARSNVPGGVPADGNFHHVVATMDGTLGSARIYIDGVEANTVQVANATLANTAFVLAFGSGASTAAVFDEFALYDQVLPACEIADHYTTGAGEPYIGC